MKYTVKEKIVVLVPCARSFLTFRESEGFTTFGDQARIEACMPEALGNLEAIFIANGIPIGLEVEKLEEHVEQWLRQCEEREERSARRQEETLSTEFDKISKRLTSASPRRMRVTVKPPVRVPLEVQRKLPVTAVGVNR